MRLEGQRADTHEWARLYDDGVRQVHSYLRHRCGDEALAQDLTSETFLTVARSAATGAVVPSMAWLITVARNKLIDHLRRAAVEESALRVVSTTAADSNEPDGAVFERGRAMETLYRLAHQHRAVLTLRYLDGLSLAETARLLNRTEQATQALLARAKAEFRQRYDPSREDAVDA
jgi:RNA polymerase sigma-70 factor, ECF subfamily